MFCRARLVVIVEMRMSVVINNLNLVVRELGRGRDNISDVLCFLNYGGRVFYRYFLSFYLFNK